MPTFQMKGLQTTDTGVKSFRVSHNVGQAKYLVSHHDGVKQHKDGSPFFDIAIFSNKRKLNTFVNGLSRGGYRQLGA